MLLHLIVIANRYFKGVGSTQTSIFSLNTVFHFLHSSQESLRHVCFLQFSFISVQPLHFYISLWNLQLALVTDFPSVIIITSVLFRRSKAAYWLCSYKRYLTKFFCIYRKLFRNRSQRTVSPALRLQTWTYRNGMCIMDAYVREGNVNEKLYFHKEKDWLDAVPDSNCWKINLPIPDAGASNKLIFNGEIARSWEWKRDRPIHHDPDSTIRRKVTRK